MRVRVTHIYTRGGAGQERVTKVTFKYTHLHTHTRTCRRLCRRCCKVQQGGTVRAHPHIRPRKPAPDEPRAAGPRRPGVCVCVCARACVYTVYVCERSGQKGALVGARARCVLVWVDVSVGVLWLSIVSVCWPATRPRWALSSRRARTRCVRVRVRARCVCVCAVAFYSFCVLADNPPQTGPRGPGACRGRGGLSAFRVGGCAPSAPTLTPSDFHTRTHFLLAPMCVCVCVCVCVHPQCEVACLLSRMACRLQMGQSTQQRHHTSLSASLTLYIFVHACAVRGGLPAQPHGLPP